MPQDAVIGRDLAEQLTKLYSGLIKEVAFTYDAFIKLEDIQEDAPFCKISPSTFDHTRESRVHWRESVVLTLTLISKVGPTDDETWIDQWLDSWDTMVRQMRGMTVLQSKQKVMSVDYGERYDPNIFHNYHRLLTQATISFSNVS